MNKNNVYFEPAIYSQFDESILNECTASYSNLIGFGFPQRPTSPSQIQQMVDLSKSLNVPVIWNGTIAKVGVGEYSVNPQDTFEGAVQRILGITIPSSSPTPSTPAPTPIIPRIGMFGGMGAAIAAAQAAAAKAAAEAAAQAAAAKAAADAAAAKAAADKAAADAAATAEANRIAAESAAKAAADKAAADAAAKAAAESSAASTAAQNAKTPEEAKAAENKATEAAATASEAASNSSTSIGKKKFLGMPMGVGIGVVVGGVAILGFVAWKLLKK